MELRQVSNEVAALAIFLLSYMLISVRRTGFFLRFNRPSAALTGAVLMVLATDLTLEQAYEVINWHTITLLLGMMLIVAYLRLSYFFDWAAYHLLRAARSPAMLLWTLVFASGLLSALFVNDTICLMFTPIVLVAVARAGLNPVPFLLAVAIGSNVGSVLTLTGNPQNMICGIELTRRHPEWSYARFTLLMLPIGALSLMVSAAVIALLYRRELRRGFADCTGAATEIFSPPDRAVPRGHAARAGAAPSFHPPRTRFRLMRRTLIVLGLTLAGFLLFPRELPLVAVCGGVAAMATSRRNPARALAFVDWPLLLFFGGLFVIVGGVDRSGVVEQIHRKVSPLFSGSAAGEVGTFSAVSVLLSNLLSNVPYVVVAGKWVESFTQPGLGWFTLAMASTLAGNLTIFGSVANMIVVELSRDRVHISFWEYCRAGIPITIATTAIGVAFTWAYHVWLLR